MDRHAADYDRYYAGPDIDDSDPASAPSSEPPRRAVVLLSGGADSATVLGIAKAAGFDVLALSFRYGQRHDVEVRAAAAIAARAGVPHTIAQLDPVLFGGSALTRDIAVPKGRSASDMASGIPVTYVPARNTVFLSCALAFAETHGARDIFLGVNAIDYSGYPDCRPEYLAAFEALAALATASGVAGERLTVWAPLVRSSKADIIRQGIALDVNFAATVSCYDPSVSGLACGECDSCRIRLQGFAEAGLTDPAPYQVDDGTYL